MSRGFSYKIVGTVIAVLVCLIVINIALGQASNQHEFGLVGQMEISGEFLITVHYSPNPQDPSRLGAVDLEISTIGDDKSIHQVLISMDHGINWIECFLVKAPFWSCNISSRAEVAIKDFQELEIVVN